MTDLEAGGWVTKDSGHRQQFDTGAVRDTQEGKGRYDLMSPFAARRVAGVYERGASKYGPRNFEKGIPYERFIDSAMRHLKDAMRGDNSEDHIAQAAWNLDALMHTEALVALGILPPELDNLPRYIQQEPSYPVQTDKLEKYVGIISSETSVQDEEEYKDDPKGGELDYNFDDVVKLITELNEEEQELLVESEVITRNDLNKLKGVVSRHK